MQASTAWPPSGEGHITTEGAWELLKKQLNIKPGVFFFEKDSNESDHFSQRAARPAQFFSDRHLKNAPIFVRKTGRFGRLVLTSENAHCFNIAVRATKVVLRVKDGGGMAQPRDFWQDPDSESREIVIHMDGDVFGCDAMNTPCLERRTIEDKYVKMVVQVSFVIDEDGDIERTEDIPIYWQIHSGCLQEHLVLRWKHLKEKVPQVFRTATQATEDVTLGRIWPMKGTTRKPADGNP